MYNQQMHDIDALEGMFFLAPIWKYYQIKWIPFKDLWYYTWWYKTIKIKIYLCHKFINKQLNFNHILCIQGQADIPGGRWLEAVKGTHEVTLTNAHVHIICMCSLC